MYDNITYVIYFLIISSRLGGYVAAYIVDKVHFIEISWTFSSARYMYTLFSYSQIDTLHVNFLNALLVIVHKF